MKSIKIIKTNNLHEGCCTLLPRYAIHVDGRKWQSYLCIGNSFDEAIDYFMLHWGNIAKHKPIHSLEVEYNIIDGGDFRSSF